MEREWEKRNVVLVSYLFYILYSLIPKRTWKMVDKQTIQTVPFGSLINNEHKTVIKKRKKTTTACCRTATGSEGKATNLNFKTRWWWGCGGVGVGGGGWRRVGGREGRAMASRPRPMRCRHRCCRYWWSWRWRWHLRVEGSSDSLPAHTYIHCLDY